MFISYRNTGGHSVQEREIVLVRRELLDATETPLPMPIWATFLYAVGCLRINLADRVRHEVPAPAFLDLKILDKSGRGRTGLWSHLGQALCCDRANRRKFVL